MGICLAIFALEIGVFLTIFPWTRLWSMSYVPVYVPEWAGVWMSRYFRGAVTGLGLLNLLVAAAEFLKQVKAVLSRAAR